MADKDAWSNPDNKVVSWPTKTYKEEGKKYQADPPQINQKIVKGPDFGKSGLHRYYDPKNGRMGERGENSREK